MRSLSRYFLFLASIFAFSCNQNTVEPSEITQLLDNYAVALGSKSAQQVAELFHKDAQLMPEGKAVVDGRAAIQDHFKGLESIDFEERFEIQEVLPSGNFTIVRTLNTGKWSSLDKTDHGSFSVKGQMVLKRDGKGNLKIFRYMYNSNAKEETVGSEPIKGSFVHVVYFWLKEPANAEARAQFVTSLSNFIDHSEFIQSKHIGTPADTDREVIDNSYTYALVVTFNSKEDQDQYQAEEGHIKFIEESKALWEKVLVYDSEHL
ncbi:MAG: Dabb family protein [Mameliella sp.]|nr:Dabb family protein [Phaeodactylibacter sp.]